MSNKEFHDNFDLNFALSSFHDENFSRVGFMNKFVDISLKEVNFSSLEACNLDSISILIESSLKKLENLQEEIITEMETIQLENELNHSSIESEQSKLVKDLEHIKKEFESLENKIIKFSDRSINLGNQLSVLDQSKEASIIASELIQYFLMFNSLKGDEKDWLFRDPMNVEELGKSAKYVYFLNEVSKNLNMNEFEKAKLNITNKYENIRKKLISEFNDSFSRRDNERIQKIMIYIDSFDLIPELANNYIKKAFKSVNILNLDIQQGLKSYEENKKVLENCYRNVYRILTSEFTSIENYFISIFTEDKQYDIIKLFLAYAFENFVEYALKKVLSSTEKLANSQEMHLKYYDLFYSKTESLLEEISKLNSIYSSKLIEIAKANFHIIFDEIHEKYFFKEKAYLTSILIEYFSSCNSKVQTDIEKTAYHKKNSEKDSVAGLLTKEEAQSRIESLNEILTNETTEFLFSNFEQTALRCYRLSRVDEKDKNTSELIHIFLREMASILNTLINFSIEIVPNLSRKTTLNEKYFDIIFKLNWIVQRIEISLYKTTQNLIKLKDFEDLMNEKERISKNSEEKTWKSLTKALDCIKIHANKILKQFDSRQEYYIKDKFSPGESSTTCKEFIKFISNYLEQIKDANSENLKKLIMEMLGQYIMDILIQNYSSLKINLKGLIQLSIDLDEYRMLIKQFGNSKVEESFEVFKALINLYKINKDDLKEYRNQEKRFEFVDIETINSYIENKPTK